MQNTSLQLLLLLAETLKIDTETQYSQYPMQCLGFVIKNCIHQDIKQPNNLHNFKNRIEKRKPLNCPCRLLQEHHMGTGVANLNVV